MQVLRMLWGLAIAVALALGCTSSTPPSPSRAPASPTPAPKDTAAASGITAAPIAFSGVIKCGPAVRQETTSTNVTGEGVTVKRNRLGAWQQTVTMSDPRLEGTTYHTYETDSYGQAGPEAAVSVSAATRRIENEGGSWVSRWYEATDVDGKPLGNGPFVLVGEGGYQGLIAVYRITATVAPCDQQVSGFVFSGMSEPTLWTPE